MARTPEGDFPLSTELVEMLRQLGENIRLARIRRRFTVDELAKMAHISRPTMCRVEMGAPGVSMGVYANVLRALQLDDGLKRLADQAADEVGVMLMKQQLPKRVRRRKDEKDGS